MTQSTLESSIIQTEELTEEKSIRVLHIDDEIEFLNTSKKILETKDYFDIDTVSSVKDAMKKLNHSAKPPHIIVVQGKDNEELIGFIGKEELISTLRYWGLSAQHS